MRAALIYPHQLFDPHPAISGADLCVLVEDPLFFRQYPFHGYKRVLHRASMKHFAQRLESSKHQVRYVDAMELEHSGDVAKVLRSLGVQAAQWVDPCDDWLSRRLIAALNAHGIKFTALEDPHFLTPLNVFERFSQQRSKWFFTEFYVQQRKRMRLLIEEEGKPVGGKWSYDPENRKKLPKGTKVPPRKKFEPDQVVRQAQEYVKQSFADSPGSVEGFHYPVTQEQAIKGLNEFLTKRLAQFGDYEDAIDAKDAFLFHSVLTPALNIGLISPQQVVDAAMRYQDRVPLNALEGFIRQVIGWREYMRGVYLQFGRRQRTGNAWNHEHPMPAAFYDGTTGIEPVDCVIRRVLQHAYCHHIERLMILGNFMLLCEISPHAIYRWFMELFIDAYDWVMVPNVYGMSQHADGGLITTKPYISGSSYVLKMSNFPKGSWCPIWDALYWRFIHKQRDFFTSNPRMSVMVAQLNRMGSRLDEHLDTADAFLKRLHR